MRRREVIALLGGAAAVPAIEPLAALAQPAAMPVVGFLSSVSPGPFVHLVAAFRKGLSEDGYVQGQNVAIDTAGRRVNMIAFRRWRPIWSRGKFR